ncbi:glycosyltransferase family 2 protein [Ruegeria sp. HKCCA6948]|uniref:glycosyltransferase family 2 protein n=1 Tax=unclassified Ruegeria TaxID=2625375 RepID=UPI003530277E
MIILTRDEALHIARAIASVRDIADRIMVVDSGSEDDTCQIARAAGAEVLHHPWRNYADQFNWALDQIDAGWVMRLDADEVVSAELRDEIGRSLPNIDPDVAGIFVPRYMNFLQQPVKRGGLFPVYVLRLFRAGKGRCETRWMDEHIKVQGNSLRLKGTLLDDNLKPLSWWVDKHNHYASREVVDLLNLKYRFLPHETIGDDTTSQAGRKRWVKEAIYARLPTGLRAFAYFLWRFVVRFGVFDTVNGRKFHLLQGFWYRYLVDLKLQEVEVHMRASGSDAPAAIKRVLGIDVSRN